MCCLLLFCLLLLFNCATASPAAPLKNITIEVPEATPVQSDQNTLCLPASNISIVIFILANYLAHAATTTFWPGATTTAQYAARIQALIYPGLTIPNAIGTIVRCARLEKSPLRRAVRGQAFVSVIRTSSWKPQVGETLTGVILLNADTESYWTPPKSSTPTAQAHANGDNENLPKNDHAFSKSGNARATPPTASYVLDVCGDVHERPTQLYGKHLLPEGYGWAVVPPNADILLEEENASDEFKTKAEGSAPIEMQDSQGMLRVLFAVVQVLYASVSLYEASTGQIKRLGYGAAVLTVIPYLLMSILNFVASICSPDFPYRYVVWSEVLEEARRRGGVFTETVGCLVEKREEADDESPPKVDVTFGRYVRKQDPISGAGEDQDEKSKKDDDGDDDNLMKMLVKSSGAAAEKDEQEIFLIDGHPTPKTQNLLLLPDRTLYESFRHDKSWRSRVLALLPRETPLIVDRVIIPILFSACCIAVIGIMTRFSSGESSFVERFWVMGWIITGSAGYVLQKPFECTNNLIWWHVSRALGLFIMLLAVIFAIGGFVIVGIELRQFGDCTKLT